METSESGRVAEAGSGAAVREFARAVALGLSDTPRWIPCRFLYDERGSGLFERICEQPEYYLTRTESGILARHAEQIRAATGPVTVIELGAGSAVKTGHLLAAYDRDGRPVRYMPVDVSRAALAAAERRIADRHPAVRVTPIAATYEEAFPLFAQHSPALVLFLGSTVGNFAYAESRAFWGRVERALAPGDFFLLGVDLVKDKTVLEAAYNDAAGVTAEFTRNLFVRMNRELGAGVDVAQIEHVARYNEAWRWVEIFARFRTAQTIRVAPLERAFEIAAGEQILVEISRKFVLENLERFVTWFGFSLERVFTDERRWFAVLLLKRR